MGEVNKKIQPSVTQEMLFDLLQFYKSQLTNEAVNYLNERGIKKETVDTFPIGFENEPIGFQTKHDFFGYFRNRIVFPLNNIDGEIVDLVGRSIDEKEPKYKSLVGIENVYFNEKVLKNSEDVILCHSIFDVLSLEQVNIASICLISNQLSESQIEKVSGKRVFLCFGNDEIGRREGNRLAKAITDKVKEFHIIHLPEGLKDINDFFVRVKNPLEEFIRLINETLKNSLMHPISPDSHYLVHFQEEYMKRHKGKLKGLETGFKALDEVLMGGLQEGLYLIGGEVSVGKTTLLKQLVDKLAEKSPVILVSWDMTSFELWVKSMSRLTRKSSQEILAGKIPDEEILLANKKYSKIADNIWTLDIDIDSSLEEIAIKINKILQNINKKPVIVFDYLQRIILKKNLDDSSKEQQIQIVYNLHNWTRQWGIPIILAANGKEDDLNSDVLATTDVYLHLERDKNDEGIVLLDIKKNRNGMLGNINLYFNPKIGEFLEDLENTD